MSVHVVVHQLAFVECDVPVHPALVRWLCGQAVIFFILFSDFYVKAYRSRDRPKVSLINFAV